MVTAMRHGATPPSRAPLDALIGMFAEYVALPCYDAVIVALACAATAELMDADPTWIALKGSASTAKTEILRLCDNVADESIDEVTPAGLLGWMPARGRTPGKPIGLLHRRQGLATFALIMDMSTITDMGDRDQRSKLYAMLRRAYDGRTHREIGGLEQRLHWHGRLTLLAAATHEIDRVASHTDALGPRWLYYLLPELDPEQRRTAAAMSRRWQRQVAAHRRESAPLATAVILAARERISGLSTPTPLGPLIDELSDVVAYGRAAVPVSSYGKREVIGLADVEGPARLAGQLDRLALGLTALGLSPEDTAAICRATALSCIPRDRLAVLRALVESPRATPNRVHRITGASYGTVKVTLDVLQAIGLASFDGAEDIDADQDRSPKAWRLEQNWASRFEAVFGARLNVSQSVASYPPPPQEGGELAPTTCETSDNPRSPLHAASPTGPAATDHTKAIDG
jgi:hypothetical protein